MADEQYPSDFETDSGTTGPLERAPSTPRRTGSYRILRKVAEGEGVQHARDKAVIHRDPPWGPTRGTVNDRP